MNDLDGTAATPAGPTDGRRDGGDEFDPGSLSYEQARDALVDVVRRLESGAPTLEESLALWERGEALARRCEEWLAGAQSRLDTAIAGRNEPGADAAAAAEG